MNSTQASRKLAQKLQTVNKRLTGGRAQRAPPSLQSSVNALARPTGGFFAPSEETRNKYIINSA